MNDIPSAANNFEFILYADDTSLLSTINIPKLTHDTPIERVSNFNFLELTVNENMSWKLHVDIIAN